MRLGARVALLALPVLSLACGGGEQSREPGRSEFFGVNAQFLSSLPPDRWGVQLEAMRRGRLGVVRRDASWGSVEPDPPTAPGRHVYRWAATDELVRALADHGLRWYPIIDYSAAWAASLRGDAFSPPTRNSEYTAFARALAERYGRNGRFWRARDGAYPVTAFEIWNEPNTSLFWRPQTGAPERYASLYREVRKQIHEVDQHARVVVGGLSTYVPDSTPVPGFLRRMAARLGGLRRVDAVGLHPYGDSLGAVRQSIREARRALDRLGGAQIPLDVTEIGWSTVHTPETTRARWLAALARALPRSGCRVEILLPHTWLTPEANRANAEDWFGIANQDGSLKPSARAYVGAIRSVRHDDGGPPDSICPAARG